MEVAGNITTLPVIGWYMLLALVAVLPRSDLPVSKQVSVSKQLSPGNYEPKSLAQTLASLLESKWAAAIAGCRPGGDMAVSVGSLCSGADFVKDFCMFLADAITAAIVAAGTSTPAQAPGATARVRVIDALACESDRKLWLMAKQGGHRPMPLNFFTNVHTIPMQLAPTVDICVLTGMCTAISGCNRNRMSLHTPSPKNVTKSTVDGCLAYVKAKTPKVVILENVAALTWQPKAASPAAAQSSAGMAHSPPRPDVDWIVAQLASMGYVAGYDLQDSCDWWVPQTRLRTYVWAHRPGLPGAAAFSAAVRCCKPGVPVLPLPLSRAG